MVMSATATARSPGRAGPWAGAIALAISAAVFAGPASAQNEETLVVAAQATPNGLDWEFNYAPADHQIRRAVYSKLLSLKFEKNSAGMWLPILQPKPLLDGQLAESWELSNGDRTITFKLRKGIMSPFGNELTSEDLDWTWTRSWALKSSGVFYAGTVLGVKDFENATKVIDQYTWSFTTPSRNALLEIIWINNDLDVFDSTEAKMHVTDDDPWAKNWLATHSAGYGPYHVTEFSAGQQVVLQPNPNWHEPAPYFKTIVYRQVSQPANQLALVKGGQADVAEFLPAQFVNTAKRDETAFKVWTTDGNRLFQIFFNWQHKPFDNRMVRKALLYATPADTIRKSVYLDLADELKSVMPPTYPGYDPRWYNYPYDIEKAKALLAEAGVENLTFELTVPSTDAAQTSASVILKDGMAKAGITVEIKQVSMAVYTQARNDGSLQAFFFPTFPIIPDAGYSLPLMYSCSAFTFTANGYCNPKYDKLVREANTLVDQEKRQELFSEAARVLLEEDAGVALVAREFWNLVTGPDIEGVSWDTPNVFYFDRLSRSK
jgi:peptide/nickel transport system substrate-binding protein